MKTDPIHDYVMRRPNYIVVSGCSGGGKSTILTHLANNGYMVVVEPFLQILKEQLSIEGGSTPYSNRSSFLELCLSKCLSDFEAQSKKNDFIFFDRGLVDSFHASRNSQDFLNAAKMFRYNTKVFFVPPWKEIYKQDDYRKHDFETAVADCEKLRATYIDLGYHLTELPKGSVKDRVDFILTNLEIKRNDSTAT